MLPPVVRAPVELTERRVLPPLVCKSRMSAAVPLVSFTVRPTTPAAVGVIVFWAVLPGTWIMQVGQLPADQVRVPLPSFCRNEPALPCAVGRVKL